MWKGATKPWQWQVRSYCCRLDMFHHTVQEVGLENPAGKDAQCSSSLKFILIRLFVIPKNMIRYNLPTWCFFRKEKFLTWLLSVSFWWTKKFLSKGDRTLLGFQMCSQTLFPCCLKHIFYASLRSIRMFLSTWATQQFPLQITTFKKS